MAIGEQLSSESTPVPDADAHVEVTDGGVRCIGAWTVGRIAGLEERLEHGAWPRGAEISLDGSAVTAMDTAGAWLVRRLFQALERDGVRVSLHGLSAEHTALLEMVDSTGVGAAVATSAVASSPLA